MKNMMYILAGIIFVLFSIFIIGTFLPKTRELTKQTIYDASPETVYNIVINTHGGNTNKRRKTKKVSKRFFRVVDIRNGYCWCWLENTTK